MRPGRDTACASAQPTGSGTSTTLASCLLCTISCSLENGTTYNAYLIFGADKTALVDASHEKFSSLFIDTLNKALKEAGGCTGLDKCPPSAATPSPLRAWGAGGVGERVLGRPRVSQAAADHANRGREGRGS